MKYIFILAAMLFVCSCKMTESNSRGHWKKHVVFQGNSFAKISTAVADDFDKDGHIDVMTSFNGNVTIFKGPEWKKFVILPTMPPDRTGRIAKRGCIHSTLMDVDGDGDMDYIGSNRMIFWLECPDDPFNDEWICRMISLDVNGAHCVTTADVDRDGKIDLIANSWRDKNESPIPNSITWFSIPEKPENGKLWKPNVFANNDAPGRKPLHGIWRCQ